MVRQGYPVSPAHFSQSQQSLHSVCTEKPCWLVIRVTAVLRSQLRPETCNSQSLPSSLLKLPHVSPSLPCSQMTDEGSQSNPPHDSSVSGLFFKKGEKNSRKKYIIKIYKSWKILNVLFFLFLMCNILRQRLAVSICSAWQYWWLIKYTLCGGPPEWSSP